MNCHSNSLVSDWIPILPQQPKDQTWLLLSAWAAWREEAETSYMNKKQPLSQNMYCIYDIYMCHCMCIYIYMYIYMSRIKNIFDLLEIAIVYYLLFYVQI